jgi:carbon-monoxide dehydrogenase medium subunit
MKPAPFEYSRPADVDEACALLVADENARVIAGGQTLVPMMAMRLARPSRLVDISRIAELSYVAKDETSVTIGATTRQCTVERHPLVAAHVPLLAQAMPWIGHAATRARGTVGGSLANADPAAELPLIAVALDATLTYRDVATSREIAAKDFFLGLMTTALPATACLTAVRFPLWQGRVGVGFHEVNARRSDFAFAAAAAQVLLDEAGVCRRLAVAVGAVAERPVRLKRAEATLTGTGLDASTVRAAVEEETADIDTMQDLHASAAYRRRAAAALAARAIEDALTAAEGPAHGH